MFVNMRLNLRWVLTSLIHIYLLCYNKTIYLLHYDTMNGTDIVKADGVSIAAQRLCV